MNQKRYHWIDVVRGIGIILVIIGHCHRPEIVLKIIQSFHMPLFFILSGYLFSIKDESFFENTKKLLKRYIKPYAVLGLINYFAWLFIKQIQSGNPTKTIELAKRYIIGLLYSRGTWYWMPNCSPIWFLTAIFIACILFRFVVKQKRVIQFSLIVASIVATILLCNYEPFKLPWNIDSAIWGQSFMYFGYTLKSVKIEIFHKKKLLCFVSCIVLLAIGVIAALYNPIDFISMDSMICGNIILSFISSLAISTSIIIFIVFFIEKNRILELFGRNTIIILGFNYLINFFVYKIWDKIFDGNEFQYYWAWQCLIQICILGLMAYVYEYKKKQNIELY